MGDFVVSSFNEFDFLSWCVALEGQIPDQQAIEYDAHGPNVDSSIDLPVLDWEEALGRHIVHRAGIDLLKLEIRYDSGNAEIDDFDLLLLVVDEQQVFQFKIPMDEAVLVAVEHSLHHLFEERFGLVLV